MDRPRSRGGMKQSPSHARTIAKLRASQVLPWRTATSKRSFRKRTEAAALCTQISSPRNSRPSMLRRCRASWSLIAIVLSLLPVVAPRPPVPHGPCTLARIRLLPGYQQPPNNSLPAYFRKMSGFAHGAPATTPPGISIQSQVITGTMATVTISAGPGFYGGRYNGGSFGPCWTADADRADLECG